MFEGERIIVSAWSETIPVLCLHQRAVDSEEREPPPWQLDWGWGWGWGWVKGTNTTSHSQSGCAPCFPHPNVSPIDDPASRVRSLRASGPRAPPFLLPGPIPADEQGSALQGVRVAFNSVNNATGWRAD